MAVEPIGLNLDALKNITPPTFDSNITIQERIAAIPRVANESTNGLLGWGVIISFFITFLNFLMEREELHGFGYDGAKAMTISALICSIMGLMFVMVGWIYNFRPVGVVTGIAILGSLILIYLENKDAA